MAVAVAMTPGTFFHRLEASVKDHRHMVEEEATSIREGPVSATLMVSPSLLTLMVPRRMAQALMNLPHRIMVPPSKTSDHPRHKIHMVHHHSLDHLNHKILTVLPLSRDHPLLDHNTEHHQNRSMGLLRPLNPSTDLQSLSTGHHLLQSHNMGHQNLPLPVTAPLNPNMVHLLAQFMVLPTTSHPSLNQAMVLLLPMEHC